MLLLICGGKFTYCASYTVVARCRKRVDASGLAMLQIILMNWENKGVIGEKDIEKSQRIQGEIN